MFQLRKRCKTSKTPQLEWGASILTISLRLVRSNLSDEVELLPVTDDLMKIRKFMKEGIKIHLRGLGSECVLQKQ